MALTIPSPEKLKEKCRTALEALGYEDKTVDPAYDVGNLVVAPSIPASESPTYYFVVGSGVYVSKDCGDRCNMHAVIDVGYSCPCFNADNWVYITEDSGLGHLLEWFVGATLCIAKGSVEFPVTIHDLRLGFVRACWCYRLVNKDGPEVEEKELKSIVSRVVRRVKIGGVE